MMIVLWGDLGRNEVTFRGEKHLEVLVEDGRVSPLHLARVDLQGLCDLQIYFDLLFIVEHFYNFLIIFFAFLIFVI